MSRRLLVGLFASPLLAVGCNALLGIDDATYAPLDGGGAIELARSVVRVPVGKRRTVGVTTAASAGITRLRPSATRLESAGVDVDVAASEGGGYSIGLTAPDSVSSAIDETITVDALDARGLVVATFSLRVLVGAPGERDVSFGDGGVLIVDRLEDGTRGPVANSVILFWVPDYDFHGAAYPIAAIESKSLVGSGDGALYAIDEDGRGARLLSRPMPGCTIEKLLRRGDRVLLGGSCDGRGYLEEVALDGTNAASLVRDAGRFRDLAEERKPWLLDVDGRIHAPASPPIQAPVPHGSALVASDGGLAVVGETSNGEDAGVRIGVHQFLVNAAGELREPRPLVDHLELRASEPFGTGAGTSLANGGLVVSAGYLFRAPLAFRSSRWLLAPDGGLADETTLDEVTAITYLPDDGGRFVAAEVIQTSAGPEVHVRRFFEDDGRRDGAFARGQASSTPFANCEYPALARDADGMILVTCSDERLQVARLWP